MQQNDNQNSRAIVKKNAKQWIASFADMTALTILPFFLIGLITGACSKKQSPQTISDKNLVVAGLHTDKTIDNGKQKMRVLSALELQKNFPGAKLNIPNRFLNLESSKSSLVVEMPLDLINENYLFGGIVSRVLDPKSDESLGDLKLASYSETLAKLKYDKANKKLQILGCDKPCSEGSNYSVLIDIPVALEYPEHNSIFVDFSQLDHELDIVQNWNKNNAGIETHNKKDLQIASVDYSLQTLILETNSHYERIIQDQEPYTYQIYTRWYLKLTSGFDPNFTSREPLPSVGFFEAPGAKDGAPKINHFSTTEMIKYFIKDVPSQYRKSFSDALDGWNTLAEQNLGHKILEYEFLETNDPRYNLVVPGDIRYNVIAWDVETSASYGGLGPAVAHPVTGQTFSGNVLVQGPTVEKIYKKWFALGQNPNAEQVQSFYRALNKQPVIKKIFNKRNQKYKYIRTTPELYDARFAQKDFDLPPVGMNYDDYMYGYFYDMVAHEMGHNLGLRHNFRGNLSSDDSMTVGSVSRSVMEYLGRPFRYLDRIGAYDAMAISYGYAGVQPQHNDWYCTDEDEFSADPQKNSAECRSDDASSDPFQYYSDRLKLAYKLLVNQGSDKASAWTTDDMSPIVEAAADGVIAYAVSAESTGSTWTNFFGKNPARPNEPVLVPAYVSAVLNTITCNSDAEADIAQKATDQDKEQTKKLIEDFQKSVAKRVLNWDPNQAKIDLGNFKCVTPPSSPFDWGFHFTAK